METRHICKKCGKKPVLVKKHNLCSSCYHKLRRNHSMMRGPILNDCGIRLYDTPLYKWMCFQKRLISRYGDDFIHDLLMLKKTPKWTLVFIGRKYGVTREYIRQVFYQYFGYKYTECMKEKNELLGNDILPCPHDPRHKVAEYKKGGYARKGAKIELKFKKICEKKGFVVENSCSTETDIIVNGFNVEIKSTNKPRLYHKQSITKLYRYVIRPDQIKRNDFLVLYRPDLEKFVIVPNTFTNNGKMKSLYMSEIITDHYGSKNKYWEYIDRYDLLELKN